MVPLNRRVMLLSSGIIAAVHMVIFRSRFLLQVVLRLFPRFEVDRSFQRFVSYLVVHLPWRDTVAAVGPRPVLVCAPCPPSSTLVGSLVRSSLILFTLFPPIVVTSIPVLSALNHRLVPPQPHPIDAVLPGPVDFRVVRLFSVHRWSVITASLSIRLSCVHLWPVRVGLPMLACSHRSIPVHCL